MALQLAQPEFDHLRQIVSEFPEFALTNSRYQFVTGIFDGLPGGRRLITRINFDGAASTVAVDVIRLLAQFGQIIAGREALSVLIDALLDNAGEDDTAVFLRGLIDSHNMKVDEKPALAKPEPVPVPESLLDAAQRYVFISYARPQAPVADEVEKYLRATGFRVFRDVADIRGGMDWNLTIEKGLEEATHMVLLLSAASMPYRKEVYREWFAFDQARKPIVPLYVEDCKLPSRLIAVNYIDARSKLTQALASMAIALNT